jgi:hypothetical protein
MSESSRSRDANGAPAPSPQLQRLGALVGRWRSEGHIVGDDPVPITGTDVCEWLAGDFFLVHHDRCLVATNLYRTRSSSSCRLATTEVGGASSGAAHGQRVNGGGTAGDRMTEICPSRSFCHASAMVEADSES